MLNNINMYFPEVAENKILSFFKPALDIYVKLAELRSHCTLAYTPVFWGVNLNTILEIKTQMICHRHKSGIFSLHGGPLELTLTVSFYKCL